MDINESEWRSFTGHPKAALESFKVPASEGTAVLAFIGSTQRDVVE